MAVWHHAYAFDGAKYLDDVSRVVGADTAHSSSALGARAKRVVDRADRETALVLEYLCFEASWLTEEPDRMVERFLTIMLAEQARSIPSLGGGNAHSWAVLDRLARLPDLRQMGLERLVRGDRLAAFPAALGRADLEALFKDARHLGGVLSVPAVASLALTLERLEDRFRSPNAGEGAAFDNWSHTDTPMALARAKSKAFDDATRMLKAADGRSVFLLFEQ